MRTALIAWDYPPSPSGLSTAAREIAESLAAQGCDVTVFSGDRTGTSMSDGVRIIGCAIEERSALGRLRTYAGIGHLAAPRRFRDAVASAHAAVPFDVVEATNWYAPAALLAGRRDLPLVTRNSTPASWSRDSRLSPRNRVDAWAADRLERRQAHGSAALISNTAEHGRRIADLYRLDARRPHATIGLSLSQAVLRRAGAATYPPAQDPLRILFVGRAEARKGFRELMDAIVQVAEEADAGSVANFRVDLLGVPDSDLPETLSPSARRRIFALGRQPDAMLFVLYEAAHIVAAPSRYESFGLVYQEAIAFGRPIIASAEDPSAREFVGQTGAGLLASATTGRAIAECLRDMLTSDTLRTALRLKALKAAGTFSRATLGRQTIEVYEQAVAGHRDTGWARAR
ncbi:glycosyl transferase family 1 [Rhizobium sp. Leaf384]|uniref:glycosyltransferase family 4 protein n=1 Tax=unclassified Rhizobium TaxID=2613769 RepID=UPI000713B17C|nr:MULTISPECIES: glycosyltransferase family 4 protein [unclassified Rhizobium]KQS75456.1 glycosyl transferase family 1 [Rhizobium sp. Leaf383]KQS79495.1 glycosyl transferase family 1 [Rhizobium sp. Leaf384]